MTLKRVLARPHRIAKHGCLPPGATKVGLKVIGLPRKYKGKSRPLGEEYEEGGALVGGLHRTWIDVKAFFAGNNEAMLEEGIRGEQAALEECKDVLQKQNLPPSTFVLLTAQKAHIDYGLALIKTTNKLEYHRA